MRVAIAGGGVAGLAAAAALARRGADVTLVEQAPGWGAVGAGLQITPNGARVLAALGVDQSGGMVATAVAPHEGLSGRCLARFDLTGLSGPPYRFWHRADLLEALRRVAAEAGVVLRPGLRAEAAGPGGLHLSDGSVLPADLMLGADGIHSRLRAATGETAPARFTGQTAWRAVIAGDGPPIARLFLGPGRHLVTYPLPGDRVNIVAVREEAAWAPDGWNHPDDPAALQAAFADFCPAVRALLARVKVTSRWGLFRHPVAARWSRGPVVLLGDAAHPTLPFLAQGANLALEDAWVLADEVMRGPDLTAALARYQARRAPRVTRALAAAEANARSYHLGGWRRRVAAAGLGVIGAVAPGAFLRRLDWLYGADVTTETVGFSHPTDPAR